MRPPRIIILIVFLASSFFLLGRALTSAPRNSPSDFKEPYLDPKADKKATWGLSYYNTPFSLFPPNAAISLTDDNSTSFAARPAAFGPKLATAGISGQLWIGQGFAEDTLDSDGELGCSDLPGWEGDEPSLLGKPDLREITSPRVTTSSRLLNPSKRASDTTLTAAGPNVASSPNTHERRGNQPHNEVRKENKGNSHQDTSTTATSGTITQLSEGSSSIEGKVALLMRGGCGFLEKVMWAQRRGAIAVVVGDNQKGGPLVQMFAHGDGVDQVKIPSVFTARTTAQLLSTLAQPGSFSKDVVYSQDDVDFRLREGADSSGSSPDETLVAPSKINLKFKRAVTSLLGSSRHTSAKQQGWFSKIFGWGHSSNSLDKESQAAASGRVDWVLVDDWNDEKDKVIRETLDKSKKRPLADDDLSADANHDRGNGKSGENGKNGGKKELDSKEALPKGTNKIFGTRGGQVAATNHRSDIRQGLIDKSTAPETLHPQLHDGLWVTITPTNSASPFFDTLLVLVISPLVTLTVVYALLILRARIRRRRWRAPKSVVERLPVRTYHTVAVTPGPSTRQPSPSSTSPTTPLLQQPLPSSRPRSRTTTGVPDTNDLLASNSAVPLSRSRSRSGRREPEKSTGSFSREWKKSMGRQVECVVCLEEYVDGISQVMSLPCGHEFHADCITPWLTTRRRTCPICKGDVVRSIAHASSSSPRYEPYRDDSDEDLGSESEEPRSSGHDTDVEQGLLSIGTDGSSQRASRREGWLTLWSRNARTRSPIRSPRSRDDGDE